MAEEMSSLVRNQILMSSGTAMLAWPTKYHSLFDLVGAHLMQKQYLKSVEEFTCVRVVDSEYQMSPQSISRTMRHLSEPAATDNLTQTN